MHTAIRNPKYNAFGGIDCEINHTTLGWIPFAAHDNDPVGDSQVIWDSLIAGEAGPIAPYVPPAEPPEPTFEEKRTAKLKSVDILAKQKRDDIVQNYSAAEMASWPIKREEALKWIANPNYDIVAQLAPSLNTEASYRQVSLDALVTKVLEKANQFSLLEAAIAGYTGYLQDLIRAINIGDTVALDAIDVNAGWPV